MPATRERYASLCQRLGAKNNLAGRIAIDESYNELMDFYTKPDRCYHDIGHINEGLDLLDETRGLADNPDAIEMSWWWHDAKMDATPGMNEFESWKLAQKAMINLGIRMAPIAIIGQLILATRHDHIPNIFDKKLIIDIDLFRLSSPPELFDFYTAKIREEYRELVTDDKNFMLGRADFLKKFVQGRDTIYLTPYFRDKYEKQAQENIRRFITKTHP